MVRNKDCKDCPQNKREDVVWKKGYSDGQEVGILIGKTHFKKVFWIFYRKV